MDIEKKQIVDKEINKIKKPEENNNNTKILQKNGIQTEIKKEENINNKKKDEINEVVAEKKIEKMDKTENNKEINTEKDNKEKKNNEQNEEEEEEEEEGEEEIEDNEDEEKNLKNDNVNNNKEMKDDKNETLKKNENLSEKNNIKSENNNNIKLTQPKEEKKEEKIDAKIKEKEMNNKNTLVTIEGNGDIKKNNMTEEKPKGYNKIFRKIFKEKDQALKNITKKQFKKWKDDSLNGVKVKKTIIVRIAVSREKDRKNNSNSSEKKLKKNNSVKNNIIGYNNVKNNIGNNNVKNNNIKNNNVKNNLDLNKFNKTSANYEKDKHIKKSEFKPYKINTQNNKEPKNYNNIEWKNHSIFNSSKDNKPNKKIIYDALKNINNNKNSISNRDKDRHLLNKNGNEKPKIQMNKIYQNGNKKLQKCQSTFNQPIYTIQNNNRVNRNKENNNYNNTIKHDYIYKSNNEKLFDKLYGIKPRNDVKKDNKNIKIPKIFNLQNNGYNCSGRNTISSEQPLYIISRTSTGREKQFSKTLSNYNLKKSIPSTKNTSDKKIEQRKSFINNNYRIKNSCNDNIFHSPQKEGFVRKIIYSDRSYKKSKNTVNKINDIFDRDSLKRGITKVIQFYSGIKEEIDNYYL